MVKVAPGKVTVKGLDVSHYDGKIDFSKVKAGGFEFCIAKCTEYSADKTYERNRASAMAAGLIFGAYDFFHPAKDPRAQADLFLKNCKLDKGNLVPMLDWETSDNLGSQADHDRAQIWLDIMEKEFGKPPIIYGGPYFLAAHSLPISFAKYPLFIAEYGVSEPYVPKPWTKFSFWQKTDKGDVPGIPAPGEDCDIFNGSMVELRLLTIE